MATPRTSPFRLTPSQEAVTERLVRVMGVGQIFRVSRLQVVRKALDIGLRELCEEYGVPGTEESGVGQIPVSDGGEVALVVDAFGPGDEFLGVE